MAQIALLLSLVFIFFALRSDIKESQKISRSFWIPFIWMLLSASKSFSFWLFPSLQYTEASAIDYTEGSPLDRAVLASLMCFALVILFKRRKSFRFPLGENKWLYMLFVYALVSVSWSEYQGVSLKRWIRAIGDILMVLLILTENDEEETIERMFRRCIIILIPLSLVFIKYFRHIGVVYSYDGSEETWIGVTRHKNSLGEICAFFSIFLLWRMFKSWPKIKLIDGTLMLLTLFLLLGTPSRSATSIGVFLLGSLLLIGVTYLTKDKKSIRKFLYLSMLFIIIIQGIFVTVLDKSLIPAFFSVAGRSATLTGRTDLWGELIKIGSQRPILGHGFGGFWLGNLTHNLWDIFSWQPTAGHNGYIDAFLDLGLVGLFLLVIFIIRSYKKMLNSIENKSISKLEITIFIMIVAHNVTESTLMKPTQFLWFLFLLCSIIAVKNHAEGEAEHQQAGE